MTNTRFSRLYIIITLFLMGLAMAASVACRSLPFQLPARPDAPESPDASDLISQVVATVSAQIPTATAPTPAEPAVTIAIPTAAAPTPLPVVEALILGNDLQSNLIDVYRRVNPSVVHIYVFNEFQTIEGTGSGFVYDASGHIITNNHVVSGSDGLEVVFSDGSRRNAAVVGTDVDSDLAVIKVESLPPGAEPVQLGDSAEVEVGQFVAAIGNPFGEAGSMSIGIVSGLGRSLASQRIAAGGGRYSLPQVIQTDAAINPGNSGGPLLNLQGSVIGVNSAIRTDTGSNSGVGFSIPVNAVKRIVPALISDGQYRYPFMGISMDSINLVEQQQLGLPRTDGAYVTRVSPGSPAAAAGLVGGGEDSNDNRALPGGDLIVAVDGQDINSPDDMISYLVFETSVGQTINLTVLRGDEEITIPLTLAERP